MSYIKRTCITFGNAWLTVQNRQLCFVDELTEFEREDGVWEYNLASDDTGDGGFTLHYIYNRKYNVSIAAGGNNVATLITGIAMNARLSFELVDGHNTNDTTHWVLNDPLKKERHMVRGTGMDPVVFSDQPANDCIWVFIDVPS